MNKAPDFRYSRGLEWESTLIEGMSILLFFAQPVRESMRADILEHLPLPLHYDEPQWSARTLYVSTQAYASVAIRFGYNEAVREFALGQGVTIRDRSLFECVTERFDDEADEEEIERFMLDIHGWLHQLHQRFELALVLTSAPIELDGYELATMRCRQRVADWLHELHLDEHALGGNLIVFNNMFYALMLDMESMKQDLLMQVRRVLSHAGVDVDDSYWQGIWESGRQ